MLEFSTFLKSHGLPFPLLGAHVSVYAQGICGLLFMLGWKMRISGLVMIANFIVAISLVHLGDTYRGTFPALFMLAGSIFFVLADPGKFSIDHYLRKNDKINH